MNVSINYKGLKTKVEPELTGTFYLSLLLMLFSWTRSAKDVNILSSSLIYVKHEVN